MYSFILSSRKFTWKMSNFFNDYKLHGAPEAEPQLIFNRKAFSAVAVARMQVFMLMRKSFFEMIYRR